MEKNKFDALMPYIISDFAKMISEKQNISDYEAMMKIYSSELYAMLEDEKTKIWQLSTPMLYFLLEQEETTGKIEFPDV